ncbi:MAG: hypothetical protein Q3988_05600 [Gemella sp.]|nr:hypothetical protein [Gemella sp.]
MEVVLSSNYQEKLKEELRELIRQTAKEEAERIQPGKRLYNATELMQYLGCGQQTLKELQIAGLKEMKVGRQRLFDIEEVYEVLKARRK